MAAIASLATISLGFDDLAENCMQLPANRLCGASLAMRIYMSMSPPGLTATFLLASNKGKALLELPILLENSLAKPIRG